MEQVIRAYGRFLLEAMVFALLLFLLFAGMTDRDGNRGVFQMIGAYYAGADGTEAETDRTEFARFVSESRVSAPVIAYRYPESLYPGSYELSALVGAVDAHGQELSVRVCCVTDPDGNESAENTKGLQRILFENSGIYILRVTADDACNRKSTREIRIPVNRREGSE